MGTESMEAVKALPVPSVQKHPRWVGKFCSAAGEGEDEENSRSEKETHLAVAELPGRKPGGLPWHGRLPSMVSAAMQALRRLTATTSSRKPTRMVKERGRSAEPRRGHHRAAERVG
jgi:hypothetical protein